MTINFRSSTKTSVNHQIPGQDYCDLILQEAQIGGTIFGPTPEGCKREFVCLDRCSWLWHEEWQDKTGTHKTRTTRYDISPSGIAKIQHGIERTTVSPSEAKLFADAVAEYYRRVTHYLYTNPV